MKRICRSCDTKIGWGEEHTNCRRCHRTVHIPRISPSAGATWVRSHTIDELPTLSHGTPFELGPCAFAFLPRRNQETENYCRPCWFQVLGEEASRLERAQRLEDAARVFEYAGRIDEAGRLRGQSRTTRLETRSVHVNLDINQLIAQVKQGGIVVPYACPRCGGTVEVGPSTQLEGLKYCEYCGTALEVTSLAAVLQRALGFD